MLENMHEFVQNKQDGDNLFSKLAVITSIILIIIIDK